MPALTARKLLLLLVTLVIGVLSRTFVTGSILLDKYLGDALYTAAIFWVLWLIRPTAASTWLAAISFGISLLVEVFQLSGVPLAMRDSGQEFLRVLSIVLGTEFSLLDILAYGVGALVCAVIAARMLRQ